MSALADKAIEGGSLKRRIATVLIVVSGAVVVVAERDLASRPSSQVRGSKMLWRIGSSNALVAFAYLRWGRRARAGA